MKNRNYANELEGILRRTPEQSISFRRTAIAHIIGEGTPSLVLFGAGSLGRHTLSQLRQGGIEPIAFADNSPSMWGQVVDGLEVLEPSVAFARHKHASVFVITIYGNSQAIRQLEEAAVKFLTFAELAWHLPDSLLPYCAIELPDKIFAESAAIRIALSMLADDKSRDEFISQLEWRTSLGRHWPTAPANPDQIYFDPELVHLDENAVIVDCGAFDGDTIRALDDKGIAYSSLIAIEPDEINYMRLKDYVGGLPQGKQQRITLHNAAVDAVSGILNFSSTGTAESRRESNCSKVTRRLQLDEILANEAPTFIKMDIEGAEFDALRGGEKVIKKNRPILAICQYHLQEDLWRIPILIRSMSDDYKIYIRKYADECWELVCYAIPGDAA